MKIRPRGLPLTEAAALPRTPLTGLLAVGVALAVVAGMSTLTGDRDPAAVAGEATRSPVERTALVCPQPTRAETATTTWYTGYTPAAEGASGDIKPGSAGLLPLTEHTPGEAPAGSEDEEDAEGDEETEDGESEEPEDADADEEGADGADAEEEAEEPDDRAVLLEEAGLPVTESTKDADAPAYRGTAEHRLAPGWTVQQTSLVRADAGVGRGLLGTACQQPDTAFWFAGASTAEDRYDYVHLINPDDSATVVDIELYGPEGELEPLVEEGITVPGGTTVPVRLSTLVSADETNLAVRVSARTGRIGAQIEVVDEKLGTDWLAPVSAPDGAVVLPGIPADAKGVRLVAYAPGGEDIRLSVRFAGPSASITPVGNESLYLRSGLLEAVDLEDLTQGEPGSLVLTPTEGTGPVVAALRVTRGKGDNRELAFIPGTAPIERQASVSGNDPDRATLTLTAPGDEVEVEVTTSPGAKAGQAVTETVTVPGGTTLAIEPELPEDTDGRYAITVRRVRGGELYAARMLAVERDDIAMFTVQTLPDDRSTVSVPQTGQDLDVLDRG
jgi:hypothetical protein